MRAESPDVLWDALPFDLTVCDGCHECGDRCIDGWECTRAEFAALLDYLETRPEAVRVCRQPRQRTWSGGRVLRCWFYDDRRRRCAVYPVRPLICRLFGHVEWLPCPRGQVQPAAGAGVALIQRYAKRPRNTFAGWAAHPDFASRVRAAVGDELFAAFAAAGAAAREESAGGLPPAPECDRMRPTSDSTVCGPPSRTAHSQGGDCHGTPDTIPGSADEAERV